MGNGIIRVTRDELFDCAYSFWQDFLIGSTAGENAICLFSYELFAKLDKTRNTITFSTNMNQNQWVLVIFSGPKRIEYMQKGTEYIFSS